MYIGALMPPIPIRPMNSPCPIHSGQGGPKADSASPAPIISAPNITVQRVPMRSAMRLITIPPTPAQSQANALASAGIERMPPTSAAMSLSATAVIQAAPNDIPMMQSATEATTQDARLSIEEEGDRNIQWEPSWRSLLQATPNLTTHVDARAVLSAALRQNARNAAGRKFPSLPRPDNEIDRRALQCQHFLGFCAFASCAMSLYECCPGRLFCRPLGICPRSPMTLRPVSLDDKYDLAQDRVLVTGYQALIRACLMQKARDRAAGLNTGGYLTGYRGSPLGGLDQQFMRAGRQLSAADIKFQPGINEELAATALWGTQQAELRGEGKFDGVFGLWYGKGPGVDRSGDVFRHANLAGTSKTGGILALMGDDHTAESSTTAHQSEFHFVDVMMPILNPAGVQEIIDYALYGWAMSRFTGTWTALKCMHETVESTGVVDGALNRLNIVMPADFRMPEGGLNIRLNDSILGQEARLHDYKRDAMLAFVHANKLNKIVTSGGRNPKIGIITTGKPYLDVRQALDELGIDEVKCNDLGLRLFKIGCVWPIGRAELAEFAQGLDLIIVVEEKRSLIEVQVREELYGTANQPVCIGKKDEQGNWLFPVKGALDPNEVAICIGERLLNYVTDENLKSHVARLKEAQRVLAETEDIAQRIPYFCSGCPHNSSTVVPPGMRAYAGIGCHYMVQWMDRSTEGFTQMGGEGVNWIGEAPFSKRSHVFQNLGDGTYDHSGSLAIRFAVASGVNITYKILFNDAVAMTGGQHLEGNLTVDMIARQAAAENVNRIVVVTDEPRKYPAATQWPKGLTIKDRHELDSVQRELASVPGVTVLIYDQTCAAEKRRRRKKKEMPDPAKRVFIN